MTDNPKDIVTMRINEVRAMLLTATSDSFLEDLHTKDQEYFLHAAFNLLDEAVEANKQI